ncbi:MAG: beta-N-acetylglucosaminidase domain-containing protein, partial [Clostridiales bacterium]|nr:beta-N-acetylglucosaminidase domain-containing protein [Clostridiales bacterium]
MKKQMGRVLSLLLALALTLGLTGPLPTAAAETELTLPPPAVDLSEGYSEDPNAYEIYPVPHSVEYGTGSFTMTKEVNVVKSTNVDQYTVDFLEEILTRFGRTMVVSDAIDPAKTNILLGVKGENALVDGQAGEPKAYPDLFDPANKPGTVHKYDSYLLRADAGTNPNGIITIQGQNVDAVYYGVATLQMMFTSFYGNKFLPVVIEDYSNTIFRGFIEGFYGGHTYAGRESQIRSIRDVKGNIYVFASKTDPYHSDHWYELYPEEELAQIEHLVEVGKEMHVEYTWSVHIGKGNFFAGCSTDPNAGAAYQKYLDNVAKLKAKFQQLYNVGVRSFHILNDDYNSGSPADVAKLLNEMNQWRKEKGCRPIVYCPNGYNVGWASGKTELSDLNKAGLDKDIYIYWTGSDVNSPITQDNISWPYEKSEHYPVTWLNYPCSEHDKAGIYLGVSSHYLADADNITGQAGIICNPVDYPEANKVAYFQMFSWGWNRDNYTSYMDTLWEDCFKYLQPEVYDAYLTIARNVSNCPDSGRIKQGFPESEYLKDTLDSVQAKVLAGTAKADDPEIVALLAEFDHILSSVQIFKADCANKNLVAELTPWLNSLVGVVNASKSGIEAAIAISNGNLDGAWTAYSAAGIGLDEWDNYKTPNYDTVTAKAGSRYLKPFATKIMDYVTDEIVPLLNPGGLNKEPTFYAVLGGKEMQASAESDKMFDGKPETFAAFGVNQKAGDYFGIDLGTVKELNSVHVLQGRTASHHDYFHKAVLECSVDGQHWTALTEKVNSRDIQVSDLSLAARYVRLRLLETGYGDKPDYWTDVREFTVETAADPETDKGLFYTNTELTGTVIEDGGYYTMSAMPGVTLANREYVGIRLPEIMGVSEITLDGALPEGITLQYSANGVIWTDGAPESSATMRYVRLVNNGDTPVTSDLPSISAKAAFIKTDLTYESTNMGLHQGSWSNIVDGNRSTLAWTNAKQTEGQYIIFDMGAKQPVYDVTLFFPEQGDHPRFTSISVSDASDPNGEWTIIGNFADNSDMDPPYRYYACNGNGVSGRYIKIEITQTGAGWIKMNELEVNKNLDQEGPAGGFSGTPEGEFDLIMDGKLSTFFTLDAVGEEGGYLQYLISEPKTYEKLSILQDPSAICGAEVQVQNLEEQWITVGVLDKGVNTFPTAGYGSLLGVRLNWEPGTAPAIAEMILAEGGSAAEVPVGTAPLRFPAIYEADTTPIAISVPNGTPIDKVGLPFQADVVLSGGKTVTIPVTWTCDNYKADTAGRYTFTGAYDLSGGLSNPGGFVLNAVVTVNAPVNKSADAVTMADNEENLALNGEVWVSGYEQQPTAPQDNKAVVTNGINDSADIKERWSSNFMKGNGMVGDQQTPAWVVVDLGEKVSEITSIKAYYHARVWPTDYEIQFSATNGDDWTTVYSVSQRTNGTDNQIDTIDLTGELENPIPADARYIRVYYTGLNTAAAGDSIGLRELEVTGTRNLDPTDPGEPEDVVVEAVMPSVAYGRLNTAFDQLELPACAVVALSDGTSLRFPVEWSSEGYDAASTEPQELTGTLDLSGTAILNAEDLTASVTVNLSDEPTVVNVLVNPTSLGVDYGTSFEMLNLPEQVVLELSTGFGVACDVTWDSTTYNPNAEDTQYIRGSVRYNGKTYEAVMPVDVKDVPVDPDEPTVSTSYAITVEKADNGTVTSSRTRASKGLTITLTVKPDEGYKLDTITVTDK